MIKAISLAAALMFAALPVNAAETPCGPYDEAMKLFQQRYSEVTVMRLLSENGYMLEVLVSESGTWTLFAVSPDRKACMIDNGAGVFLPDDAVVGEPV